MRRTGSLVRAPARAIPRPHNAASTHTGSRSLGTLTRQLFIHTRCKSLLVAIHGDPPCADLEQGLYPSAHHRLIRASEHDRNLPLLLAGPGRRAIHGARTLEGSLLLAAFRARQSMASLCNQSITTSSSTPAYSRSLRACGTQEQVSPHRGETSVA